MFSTEEEARGEEEDDILLRCWWRRLFSMHLCFFGESDPSSLDKTKDLLHAALYLQPEATDTN